MTKTLIWSVICGAIFGALIGWVSGSTLIGIIVLVVVGAVTAFVVDRWQRNRNVANR